MKLYLAAAFICTVSLLATGCRRPLDDISAPLGKLTLEVGIAPLVPGLTAVDVEGRPPGMWGHREYDAGGDTTYELYYLIADRRVMRWQAG